MKILGIVAEYNPFHNGHAYQLASAKAQVSPDYTIAVMSGNFLQRGEAALFDKYTRTKMAVQSGIDAIYELPTYYACSSAEEFATAAILTMKQLAVTHLAFGAECSDLDVLKKIASATISEDAAFSSHIKSGLSAGETYAKAYSNAVCCCLELPEAAGLLAEPNNILAICYLKAILKYCPHIQPVLIPRKDAAYHDHLITGDIASASAIRQAIINHAGDITAIAQTIPPVTLENVTLQNAQIMYLSNADFVSQIRYCLLRYDSQSLSKIYDMSVDLANRMKQLGPAFKSYEEIVEGLKTKKYTHTRICRTLIHLLLNMQQSAFDSFKENGYIFYVRLLGVSRQSTPLVKHQREHCQVPWIQKVSSGEQTLSKWPDPNFSATGLSLFQTDIFCANLYRLVWYEKYGIALPSDYETNALVL